MLAGGTMLDRLIIKNFKSIGEPGVDLELKPLTLLVGPNGSGKSSILEALAIFAQSIGRDTLQTWGELVRTGPTQDEAISIGELMPHYPLELAFYEGNFGYQYTLGSKQLLLKAGQVVEWRENAPILRAGWGRRIEIDYVGFDIRDWADYSLRSYRA